MHRIIKNVLNETATPEESDDYFDGKLYYSEDLRKDMLQLSDEHTLWKISKGIPIDDDTFYNMADDSLDMLSHMFNTKFYALGRSGRHICVDDTPENRARYDELVDAVKDEERNLVNTINTEYAVNESVRRAIRRYLR